MVTQTIKLAKELDKESRLNAIREYSKANMPTGDYHNFFHAEDVAKAAQRLAHFEGIHEDDTYLLKIAGYFHDIYYEFNDQQNEDKSALIAGNIMTLMTFSEDDIEDVSNLILATKWPTHPNSLLEQIMCDADLDNLGREDFFDRSELLRREWKVEDKYEWEKRNLEVLTKHKYYTESARGLRQYGLEKNIEKLKYLISTRK